MISLSEKSCAAEALSPLDKKVASLVSQMTAEEKIGQLINDSFGTTADLPRLGIRGFVMDDGPHGVRYAEEQWNGRSATSFPTGIAVVSTWDVEVAREVGRCMGIEFWANDKNQQLGPCMDHLRDPRSGRAAESGGEDVYLNGLINKNVILGIQDSPVIATAKHYMGESKQKYRHDMNLLLSERFLMDFYAHQFRVAVQEAGTLCVMSSYNLINDVKASEDPWLLQEILRDRWGFPFYVVSDWDNIWNSKRALEGGTEVCMGSDVYRRDLPKLVASGEISPETLDRAVGHVLRTKLLAGLSETMPKGHLSMTKTDEIKAVNLLAARKSQILLKNEGNILPLGKNVKIALVGPNSQAKNLNCFGSSETHPEYAVSVREGLERKIGQENVVFVKGCNINDKDESGFNAALEAAKKCDFVVFAGGLDATQEGEGYQSGRDRDFAALPPIQTKLINRLAEVNPNVVVVIQSGGVCLMEDSLASIKGLLYSFYAAQEAGTAIADVLFGDYNPAGRLPVTMAKNESDLPVWNEDWDAALLGGYFWFDEKGIEPTFAFGTGLSYTKFEYSNFTYHEPGRIRQAGEPLEFFVTVKNTGKQDGEEVVQLYLTDVESSHWMPKKQLRGFQRVAIPAGESKTVSFRLTADDFYYWNEKIDSYDVQSGNFRVAVGGASDKLEHAIDFRLRGNEKRPDLYVSRTYSFPRFPKEGDKVSFYAILKNNGNTPLKEDTPLKVDYFIDDKQVASTENLKLNLKPGQVALIHSDTEWTATGKASGLTVNVDPDNQIREWDENNNKYQCEFKIYGEELDPSSWNLAYGKKAEASSESPEGPASAAIDGYLRTAWVITKKDSWISLDLGQVEQIGEISLRWGNWREAVKSFLLEVSEDARVWQTVVVAERGESTMIYKTDCKARYVRIAKAEPAGEKAGLYEIEIRSAP